MLTMRTILVKSSSHAKEQTDIKTQWLLVMSKFFQVLVLLLLQHLISFIWNIMSRIAIFLYYIYCIIILGQYNSGFNGMYSTKLYYQ
ncbi:unnamed protein product [Musa textilis]